MTIELDALARPAAPWVHLWPAQLADVVDQLVAWEQAAPGKRVARVIRGARSTTVADFFAEAAAALQFPLYFGENWDAFADCLTDLRRFGDKTALAVCVIDAGKLLDSGDPDDAATLADVLAAVLPEVNAPEKPGKPRPFHFIFQCVPSRRPAVARRWRGAGLEL